MVDLVSKLDKWLPHWLDTTQLLWLQWIYALWQIVRGNPLILLLLLSILPFYVSQRRKRKTVVVVGDNKHTDYDTATPEERWPYVHSHPVKDIEQLTCLPDCGKYWYTVKYSGHMYLTNVNCLCELAKCSELHGENIIFVERLLPVSGSIAVGRKLSQTEAYEKIFTKLYHCGKGPRYVVPTCLDYGTDLNSKIWVVLSTIPVLLQARRYNRLSTLLSLVIIILDFNRGWLYKVYDDLFFSFAKFVKLNIFKEKTGWYNFFTIFSRRWGYSDTVKKCAYVAQPGETLPVRCYSKLKLEEVINISDMGEHYRDPDDQRIYMEIVKDRAHCRLKEYGECYGNATLRTPIYVS